MDVQGIQKEHVFLSTTSSLVVQVVQKEHVSVSTTSSMDAQGVSISLLPAVWS
jgi:hypothetical protein